MSKVDPERRSHSRIPVQVRVRIQYTGQEFMAESRNLSAGGVFLETDRKVPVGTRVRMQFTIPIIAKYPIRAEGEVVWFGEDIPPGLAVRFTEISDDDRALLGEVSVQYGSLLGEG